VVTAPVGAVHSAVHTFGDPEHPVEPLASNTESTPSAGITYTSPEATLGDDPTDPPVGADHNGVQVLGVPEQPVEPAAS
jgi:hypothetical protein